MENKFDCVLWLREKQIQRKTILWLWCVCANTAYRFLRSSNADFTNLQHYHIQYLLYGSYLRVQRAIGVSHAPRMPATTEQSIDSKNSRNAHFVESSISTAENFPYHWKPTVEYFKSIWFTLRNARVHNQKYQNKRTQRTPSSFFMVFVHFLYLFIPKINSLTIQYRVGLYLYVFLGST